MKLLRLTILLSLLVAAAPVGAGVVQLEIRHLWDGKPFEMQGDSVVTASGETVRISRLAYLLSEPGLRSESAGTELTKGNWFGFVDAADEVSLLTLDGLPAGKFDTLSFHLGLDEATDLSDPNQYPPRHPLHPAVNDLHWTPQGGYIFLALEGYHGDDQGFAFHLGKAANRMAVEIPLMLDTSEPTRILIDFHLDRFFGDSSLVMVEHTATHSREGDPVAAMMRAGLENVFEIRELVSLPAFQAVDSPTVVSDIVGTPFSFRMKKGFPIPELPHDFPLTEERVALGEMLFHEKGLSVNGTVSCATCHDSARAFTDGEKVSVGVEGRTGQRNSMPLVNLAWKSSFFWDGRTETLRDQVLEPIEAHEEMAHSLDGVEDWLEAQDAYPESFEMAFGDPAVNRERIAIALEQFLLTLTSLDSKFDRAARGGEALTEQEQRGLELFMTEFDPRRGLKGADCFHCHSGPFFSNHRFHNNGLSIGADTGRSLVSGADWERGHFSTPSLRNIALTAPYMHDGRFATLEEVVEHYASGVERSPTLDPNIAKHPAGGLPLSSDDKAALVAFLESLTDPQFAP